MKKGGNLPPEVRGDQPKRRGAKGQSVRREDLNEPVMSYKRHAS